MTAPGHCCLLGPSAHRCLSCQNPRGRLQLQGANLELPKGRAALSSDLGGPLSRHLARLCCDGPRGLACEPPLPCLRPSGPGVKQTLIRNGAPKGHSSQYFFKKKNVGFDLVGTGTPGAWGAGAEGSI